MSKFCLQGAGKLQEAAKKGNLLFMRQRSLSWRVSPPKSRCTALLCAGTSRITSSYSHAYTQPLEFAKYSYSV